MFQKVTIIGNLGGDPETRELESGAAVTAFSVATNRRWTNQDGSQGEETVWWRVSAWNGLGKVCAQYLTKGRQVYIEGTLVPDRETGGPRVWEAQDGTPRASFELRAETMKMLGSRAEEHEAEPAPAPQRHAAPAPQRPPQQAVPQRPPQQAVPQRQAAPAQRQARGRQAPQAPAYDDDFGADEMPF